MCVCVCGNCSFSRAADTRKSILIRSNEMQLYAGVYLPQSYSTCFGFISHPSSGVHQTVTAASGTGHSVRATTLLLLLLLLLLLFKKI